jgi:hypothetical protein
MMDRTRWETSTGWSLLSAAVTGPGTIMVTKVLWDTRADRENKRR